MSLLTNATLVRVDPPDGPGVGGRPVPATPGPAIAARCLLADPTGDVRRLVDDVRVVVTAVLIVRDADYPTAAADLVQQAYASVQADGATAAQRLRVYRAIRRGSPPLSHTQLLLQAVA